MKNGIKTSNFEMVLHCSKKMEFFEIWFTHCIECAHEGCWELSIEYSMDAFALLGTKNTQKTKSFKEWISLSS